MPPNARRTRERSASNAEQLLAQLGADDVVLLHDPQTAGMVPQLVDAGVRVIWRAHIGLDLPNDRAREAWAFLIPYVKPAAAYVFPRWASGWEGLDRDRITVIAPSIIGRPRTRSCRSRASPPCCAQRVSPPTTTITRAPCSSASMPALERWSARHA